MKRKENFKDLIIVALIIAIIYWGVNNWHIIGDILTNILMVLWPFILGGIIAFILNIPMTKIENWLKKRIKTKNSKVPIRIIAITLSLLVLVAIIVVVTFLLIPELIGNIKLLINNIPYVISDVQNWILDLLNKYPDIQLQIEDMLKTTGNFNNVATEVLNYIINQAITFVGSLVSGVVTFFTALIFAIYMLSQKEYLLTGIDKLMHAYMKEEHVKRFTEIANLTNKTFNSFICGQCVEALILGIIIFIASLLCGFPYKLIIAVLTSITALIPFFGAFISMVVGAILIATTSPMQALLFIIVFLVVQQIEGNFIYPKVVGKSVGLSPMWTLMAITIGGSLFGIIGMLIGLPLASILFAILKNDVNNRTKKKKIIS